MVMGNGWSVSLLLFSLACLAVLAASYFLFFLRVSVFTGIVSGSYAESRYWSENLGGPLVAYNGPLCSRKQGRALIVFVMSPGRCLSPQKSDAWAFVRMPAGVR